MHTAYDGNVIVPVNDFRLTHPSRPASKSPQCRGLGLAEPPRTQASGTSPHKPSGSAIRSTCARDIAGATHASASRWLWVALRTVTASPDSSNGFGSSGCRSCGFVVLNWDYG